MAEALWKIKAYVTAAGGKVFEDWYWEDIGEEDRDNIRDRFAYLENVDRHLWREPRFEKLNDIGEIKKQTSRGALRVYGCFAEGRTFVCLHGVLKKVKKDTQGLNTAEKRLKALYSKDGSTHDFDRQTRSD